MGSLLTALAIALAPQLPAAPAIDVPDGYRADRYATGLTRPTAMAWSRDGRLFVAQNGGRIVVVEPGSARPRTFVRGFTEPLGLVFHRGALHVSTRGVIWRVDPETKLRRAIVRDLPFGWHQQDSIVVGTDGRLYFGNGSTCDVCREEDRRAAAILSIRPDGSDLRIEARGLRNPFGLAFRPGTSRLYVSVNGRDDLGEWNPAESVVVVRRGAHFGWPACWPDWRTRELAGRCRGVTDHLAYLEPHSAAAGLAFWRGDLFVAEWGEYLNDLHGRRVVRVDPDTGRVRRFADGFDHPLALAVDRFGGLLVADWGRGVIYRISRTPNGA